MAISQGGLAELQCSAGARLRAGSVCEAGRAGTAGQLLDVIAGMDDHKKAPLVRTAARAMRADALSQADGALLGSEEELLTRYGISRPTLRQASALLAQEQLLLIKRGVNGGYFIRRPDASGVAHTAAIYLQSRNTSLQEIIQAALPIKVEMAMLACRNENRVALQEFLQRDATRPPDDYPGFLKSEAEFAGILADLAGNNVLRLFLETLYEFCAHLGATEDIYRNRPDRIAEYGQQRNQLLETILRGDAELAAVLARRCASLSIQWAVEDVGFHDASTPFVAPESQLPSGERSDKANRNGEENERQHGE